MSETPVAPASGQDEPLAVAAATASIARPAIDAEPVELLRAFEPVVRYTRGESFLPMSVETYLADATLMRTVRRGPAQITGRRGTLAADTLADSQGPIPSGARGTGEFLTVAGNRDVDDVGDLFRQSAAQAAGFRPRAGRLARVGYSGRIVDALFSLSLLARGRVPGSLARHAVGTYRSMVGEAATHPYYGRVVRTSGWTVLQYWFFYAFNDWRSGFNGANDHEADWEQILVYLDADAEGRAVPVWAAYAQHDYHGRDLRRRWDDAEELERIGDHPVVYAGAGSHASYFRPGEYLAEQELRVPSLVRRVTTTVGALISGSAGDGSAERFLSVAFVDYARGDGPAIGAGNERTWEPVVLDGSQPWVAGYRGLWGLSVQDMFQGEDAPAGPMFNRDGGVRRSWSDPVAFAELDVEPPPSRVIELLNDQQLAVEARQAELAELIPERERALAAGGAAGLDATDGLEPERAALAVLHDEREANALRLADLRRRTAEATAGKVTSPRAHLRRVPVPAAPGAERTGVLLETWAAVSIGLMLLLLVAALLLAPSYGVIVAIGVIAVFLFIESILRSRLVALATVMVRTLALVAGVILAITFWRLAVIALAIAAGLFVMRENVAELLASRRPSGGDQR
jgi:hypothetical protein